MLKICFGDKFTSTPKSAIHDKRLSGKDLCVLNAICECKDNNTHIAHVSLTTLCDLGRVSKKTLLASLNTLEEYGYIQRERRVASNGTNISNGYTVLFNTQLPVEEIVDKHTYDTVKEVMDNTGMSLDDDTVIDYSGKKNDIEVTEVNTTNTPVQEETPVKKTPVPKAKALLAKKPTPKTETPKTTPKTTPTPKTKLIKGLVKKSTPKTETPSSINTHVTGARIGVHL